MAAYANLTEAQRERLEMLIEEAGEIVTIGTKILRHGYDNHHPDDPGKVTNRDHLDREIEELLAVANRMVCERELPGDFHCADLNAVWKRKLKWARHQGGEGDQNG